MVWKGLIMRLTPKEHAIILSLFQKIHGRTKRNESVEDLEDRIRNAIRMLKNIKKRGTDIFTNSKRLNGCFEKGRRR